MTLVPLQIQIYNTTLLYQYHFIDSQGGNSQPAEVKVYEVVKMKIYYKWRQSLRKEAG